MRIVLTAVLFTALASSVVAQAPPLQVRPVLPNRIEIRNRYIARATAWIAVYRSGGSDVAEWHDAIIGTDRKPGGLDPGDSQVWEWAAALEGLHAELLAGLYGDGKSFGEPAAVQALVEMRQFAIDDAAEDARLVEEFQQRGSAADLRGLLAQFQARAGEHARQLDAMLPPAAHTNAAPAQDPICRSVIGSLQRAQMAAGNLRAGHLEASKLEALARYDMLRRSQPALRVPPDLGGWRPAREDAAGERLQIEAAWRVAPGMPFVDTRLANRYTEAATAWVDETISDNGSEVRYTDELAFDKAKPIAPRETRYNAAAVAAGVRVTGYRLMAAIFADGTSAGAPRYTAAVADMRRVMLQSYGAVLNIVEKSKQDTAALSRELEICAAGIQSAADRAGLVLVAADPCRRAREELRRGRSVEDVVAVYWGSLEASYQRLSNARTRAGQ